MLYNAAMTKTARRKKRKAQRQQRKAQPPVQRATPATRATPMQVTDPFDLSPADIQRAAQAQQAAQRAAQRGGQRKAPVIGGNSSATTDYSETLQHDAPPRHAPPARDPGRCGPVPTSILCLEAWRTFIRADKAQYKPRHYLGISPVWRL